MKKLSVILPFGMLLVAASLAGGCQKVDSTSQDQTVMKVSPLLLEQSPDEMYDNAAVVVRAKVRSRGHSFRVDAPSGDDRQPGSTAPWIYTEWSVLPTKVYKSDGWVGLGREMQIALRGGTVGDLTMEYESETNLEPREEVILFLIPNEGVGTAAPGRYFTYAMSLGKYRVNSRSGMAENQFERRTIKLSELEAKLK